MARTAAALENTMSRRLGAAAAAALLLGGTPASAQGGVSIVAAESVYGDVARQLAGPGARITSILSNPDQDPHLFEASPSAARTIADARIVVRNGAGYDPWMTKLTAVSERGDRQVIVVAHLVGRKAGENPHLWYDPATMPAYARAVAAALSADDPAHGADYQQRLQAFLDSLKPLDAKVASLRSRFAGTPVTATEPVFGDMAAALGLVMRNERFQLAVMNDTEPRASDVAAFEDDLRQRRVRALLYNSQATDTAATRLLRIAQQAGVPVVGVTETEPPGKSYQAWMLGELDAVERALAGPSP
jgi:zinc/manganese transport system substrate-binding protein